ncbi:MAG: alpha-2-macroglobulin family protein [Ilumatobacteraceae bacterium]
MAQRQHRRAMAFLVAIGLIVAACDDGGKDATTTTTSGPHTTDGNGDDNGGIGDGSAPRLFGLRLSEGTSLVAPPGPTPLVDGDSLDQQRIDEITARLPEWVDSTSQHQAFNWPIQSSPPPRTGNTVTEPFPPTDTTPVEPVDNGPLKVLRYQPEGDVPIAPYVAITFNQAMVPVGTVSQVNATEMPFTITPELPGSWQWIGTHTVRFDADSDVIDRLSMATTYTVTVPAETKSATGTALGETVTWTFTTPPPTVQSLTPQGDQLRRDQIFVATFDQRIDAAAVLESVHLTAGDDEVAIRLATALEVASDDSARNTSENAEPDRWLAFRPVELLPTDTALTIEIGPETPSAEGPGRTDSPEVFTGRTYAPLQIVDVTCGWGSECPPGSELDIVFNNSLDGALSDAGAVTVSPDLAAMTATVSYTSLSIRGATQARTEYTITVPGSFTDVFGQTLGKDTPVTVTIGSATPGIAPYDPITTLDPFADGQQLSVLSVNHDQLRVRVYAADPAGFAAYLTYLYSLDYSDRRDPTWDVLSDETITIEDAADSTVDTPIDLSGVLDGKPGQVIVFVEPVPAVPPSDSDYYENRPAMTWVQSTQLGIDGISDATHSVMWATDLRTGAPIADVALTQTGGATATTDLDGLATLDLPAAQDNLPVVVATHGDDTAILPLQSYRQQPVDESRWFVFDDRQVYQPGETMRVKGWVRRLTLSSDATLAAVGDGASVHYTVNDSYGNELLQGDAELGPLGGFDLDLQLPATANVGPASLNLELNGEAGLVGAGNWHQFQIQQYRRPEFEVTTRAESTEPFLSTQPATLAASGNYYAGGPLANAPVDWSVSTTPTAYSPPGWTDFTFGIWSAWWLPDFGFDYPASDSYYGGDVYYGGPCCGPVSDTTVKEYHGTTDAAGTHYLEVGFEGTDGALPDLPVAISAQATITDVNRQAWSSTSSMLVHAADRYVGLRSSRTFVRQGDPLDIEAVITDVDGAAVSGVTVDVVAGRVESSYVDGTWTETLVDSQTCTVTSAADPIPCSFDTAVGGQYKVTAVVTDDHGGRNRTEMTAWVSGAASQPSRGVEQQSLTVVPDKAEYAAGDTAELLVQAPFTTGEGLVTISRNGIRDTMRFQVVDGSAVVQVPITEADVPQLMLNLEVVGATARTNDDGTPVADGPQRPAYATGSMTLPVPPVSRTLAVTATPQQTELTPGESTTIDVSVKDATGAPVEGAEFAVVVVDEAVLALSGYTLADPLGVFYAPGYDWLTTVYGRQQIRLLDPAVLAGGTSRDSATADTAAASDEVAAPASTVPGANTTFSTAAGGSEKSAADGSVAAVDVRSNFDALALFEPSATTGADGTAAIELTLPDNLTRYRVMVVAVSGADRFGSAESNITARLPLAVRPSAPRFANFGDQFELPVVVQNQSDAPLDVDVVLQTSNLTMVGPAGKRVSVPANDRVEVRFAVATADAGTAGLRATVVSGDLADSATVELPVYTPATAEAFATYGVVDDGAIDQPLLAPTGVIPQFGGLEVTTSSTSLQALTDAVLYLVDYDYETSDAYASRILAISALADVLDAFDAEGLPSPAALDEAMKNDIAGLAALQNDDGGFPYWRRYDEANPFTTIQATHALLLAREHGYTVPQYTLDMALGYIAEIESHIPSYYGQQERDSLSAYALWVRNLADQGDPAKAEQLYSSRGDELPVDAIAWLWSSIGDSGMRADIERTINNRAVETAGAANFTTTYGDSSYLIMQSDRRTDGIVLDALIANAPDSDLIPKVVTGLLANKVKGRWNNVQENSFILLALKSYFDEFEAQTPDFVAKVWLGEQFAGDHTFQGRETDRSTIAIPTDALITAGDTDLVLAKDGTGRLYYRIGLRYAPADLQLDALDRGFVVDRTYTAVDDPADVSRDADGTWHVKAGARVRVTLTMVAESQRTHVALVDPLPAGLESLNPALAVTQSVLEPTVDVATSTAGSIPFWFEGWWGRWYEHEQLRDDRTEAFTTFLPAGTYTYAYVARATTPGSYVVPPTRAEEMYAPETFGRTSTDHLVVE